MSKLNESTQLRLNQVLSLRRYTSFLSADPHDFEELMNNVQIELLQLMENFCDIAIEEEKDVIYVKELIEKVKMFIEEGKRKNDIIDR